MSRQTTSDGSYTLYSSAYQQTFHSDKGAVSEAKHVFLEASGAAVALAEGRDLRILEVGFGTGLNFFLTADAVRGGKLHYSALERDLLAVESLQVLDYQQHLQDGQLWASYLSFRQALPQQVAQGRCELVFERSRLELLIGNATEQLLPPDGFDVVYHDAFSPDTNPELWTESFFELLLSSLRAGGVLTTYSVKGEVRRRLQALGLKVEKLPGPPGGKREMLRAVKPGH